MNTSNDNEMPQALRDLIAANQAPTRRSWRKTMRIGVAAVFLFWVCIAGLGARKHAVDVALVAGWAVVACLVAAGVYSFGRRAEFRRRLALVLFALLSLAALIGHQADVHPSSLGAGCTALLLLYAAPALALAAHHWRTAPSARRLSWRFFDATAVLLAAGVPLGAFCYRHEAIHLWLTHLAPVVLLAALAAVWGGRARIEPSV